MITFNGIEAKFINSFVMIYGYTSCQPDVSPGNCAIFYDKKIRQFKSVTKNNNEVWRDDPSRVLIASVMPYHDAENAIKDNYTQAIMDVFKNENLLRLALSNLKDGGIIR